MRETTIMNYSLWDKGSLSELEGYQNLMFVITSQTPISIKNRIMGKEAQFQFQAAPQQFYTTSYENEVAYVSPGSHQKTDFENYITPQDLTEKETEEEKLPISGGIEFFAVIAILWLFAKQIRKYYRKILPLIILLLTCCCNDVTARDVVWKYTFMGETFSAVAGNQFQPVTLGGRKVNMANTHISYNSQSKQWDKAYSASCSFAKGLGMKISEYNHMSQFYVLVDFINVNKFDYVKTIKLDFSYQGSSAQNLQSKIYLKGYDNSVYNTYPSNTSNRTSYTTTNTIECKTINYGDQSATFTVNAAMPNGWILHFELNDVIYLRSIEIDYQDSVGNADINKPCHKFYANGELAHQFVDHLSRDTNLAARNIAAEPLEEENWTFAGWSSNSSYYDSDAIETTSELSSGTAAADISYYAVYKNDRPEGRPDASSRESRYYTLYSEICPEVTDSGYEVTESRSFPDGVRMKMSIDNSRFYYFSLPFDCPLSYIKFSNPEIRNYVSGIVNNAYVGDWLITQWDEANYGWEDLIGGDADSIVLQAGRGYGIGIVPSVTTDVYFHSDYNQEVWPLRDDTIEISFTPPAAGEKGYKSGWNFMGTKSWAEREQSDLNTSYVLEPTADLGWMLHSKYGEGDDFEIKPFSAFMVQTNRDLVYRTSGAQAVAAETRESHFNIVIRQEEDEERMDYTTIVANSSFSDDYEIGVDMAKMMVMGDGPEVFSVVDSTYYAVNGSSFGIGDKIRVGIYVPHIENWSISLGENIDIPEGWHIILKDNSTGAKRDLTVEDYQFSLKKGFYPNRFEVEISDLPLGVEDIDIEEGEATWMRIVSVSGIVVYEGAFDLDRLEGLRVGVYVVQTERGSKKVVCDGKR